MNANASRSTNGKLNPALIASLLDEAEEAASSGTLLQEIAFLRSRLLPLCLSQQKSPRADITIPKDIRDRWDALFATLEREEELRIAASEPVIADLRTDIPRLPGGTPQGELDYLDSAAAHARQESRDQFQALMDGDLTEMHAEENAARSGREADQIARLRADLKKPKPKAKEPPRGSDG